MKSQQYLPAMSRTTNLTRESLQSSSGGISLSEKIREWNPKIRLEQVSFEDDDEEEAGGDAPDAFFSLGTMKGSIVTELRHSAPCTPGNMLR